MPLDTIAIIVSFLLNILISFYGIIADKQAFSLNKIVWIFNLLFLSIVPFGQFLLDEYPWGRILNNQTILYANGIILLCNLVYTVVRQKARKDQIEIPAKPYSFSFQKTPVFVLYFSASALIVLLSNKGHFWERGNGVSIENGTLQLLVDKILRGVCLFGLLASIHLWKEKKISKGLLFGVLLIGTIAHFPTAIPRYWLATFYLGAMLVFLKEYLKKHQQLFETFLLGSTILLFPILSIVRFSRSEIKSTFGSIQDVFSYSFLGGDFDAYSSLCSTINYVHIHGITWGKQLATVLLFFVPRSIWPSKSVGSGALVNKLEHSDFTNFSSTFIAEGYINFGVWGSLIFMAGLALFIARYDDKYWFSGGSKYNNLVYPAAIGMMFFMLRGDLLSSFAYSVGIYCSGWICYTFSKKHC